MSATVLTDALGPRGRRRVRIASAVSAVVVAAVIAWALWQFHQTGQLTADKWRPLTQGVLWRSLGEGLLATVKAALLAMVLAVVVGGLMALGRLSRSAPVRAAARLYIEFFRGVPVLLAILFSFLALPQLGVDVSPLTALVLALSVYNSAVLAEVFRAGILSLDRGQSEAAFSIGLTYWQAQLLVIIPQAVRRMTPAIVAQLATLTKDTALGFVIGYEELLRRGRFAGEFYDNMLQSLVAVAVVYGLVIALLSIAARRLEVRQRTRLGAGHLTVVGGPEDLEAIEEAADEQL